MCNQNEDRFARLRLEHCAYLVGVLWFFLPGVSGNLTWRSCWRVSCALPYAGSLCHPKLWRCPFADTQAVFTLHFERSGTLGKQLLIPLHPSLAALPAVPVPHLLVLRGAEVTRENVSKTEHGLPGRLAAFRSKGGTLHPCSRPPPRTRACFPQDCLQGRRERRSACCGREVLAPLQAASSRAF